MKLRKLMGMSLLCFACSWSIAQSDGSPDQLTLNPLITGTGSKGHIALWKSSTGLGNSNIFQSTSGSTNGFVGVGTTTPAYNLHVIGGAAAQIQLESSVANGNPSIKVVANTPAGQAQVLVSRADGGAPHVWFLPPP